MATLSIVRWREDPVGFTGWDAHVNSEMKRRLKRALETSPELLRQHVRRIRDRELLVLEGVKEGAIASVRQILETQGAEVEVVLEQKPGSGVMPNPSFKRTLGGAASVKR